MKLTKADLHMHLEEYATKEDLKNILQMSEKNQLEAISILSYNSVDIYSKNGAFDLLAKETKNDLSKYFSGKIIPSVEMVSTMDNMPSNLGYNYDGYRSDLVLYDFNIEQINKYLGEEELKKAWMEDFNMFSQKCSEIGIKIPSIDKFVNNHI